jgi:hypothetical protein
MKRCFLIAGTLFFLFTAVCFTPYSYALNPQPEPPAEQPKKKIVHPGEAKSGIAIEEKNKASLKKKVKVKPSDAASGIVNGKQPAAK